MREGEGEREGEEGRDGKMERGRGRDGERKCIGREVIRSVVIS